MTINEIINRIRHNVEDINADIYTVAEVEDAVGTAKDEVVSLIQNNDDQHMVNKETVVFAEGENEKALTGKFNTVLLAESIPAGATISRKHDIRFLFDKPTSGVEDVVPYDLYIYAKQVAGSPNVNTYYLGRMQTDLAETYSLWGFQTIADIASGTNEFGAAPFLFDTLIVIKATINLLSARKRAIKDWLFREGKIEFQLIEGLKNKDRSQARYVNYAEDYC